MTVNFKTIGKKWQKKWEEEKAFEADISKEKKFFLTFPYPYVNGAPHIGHSYTFLRVDAYARFKRMQGYNVLFPQGFHATGEPILGVVERLKKNDPVQIETFRQFGASTSNINRFRNDPKYVVDFWVKRWMEDLKICGLSIDWRRWFVTTTLTPQYSRFVEWQYNTLKKKGYVVQGTHPVIWCPHDQSPTGDHDRLKGEGESPIEFTILKFKFKDMYICAATLRPETVFGQTNIWVNPDVEYVIVSVDDKEKWIVSKECAMKLADQLKSVKKVGSIKGKDMIGQYCTAPMIDKDIIILPSKFCDPGIGTGLVTSVPSHAPFDWQALVDLKKNPRELEAYGVDPEVINKLEPISIIKVEGFGEHPAKEVVRKLGVKDQEDFEKLKEALRIIYKKEHHTGVMKENCGKYSGMPVEEAKISVKEDLAKTGVADFIWEPTEEVICRCTTKCHVKILENQWFLKYSDEKWKNSVRKYLAEIKIYPDEARQNFENTIDWLKDKACARRSGLGTPLPWDKSWIVETLSDSTIYMAYYTISRIIKEREVKTEQLTDEVFDYIFLGKGDPASLQKKTGLKKVVIEEMKKEFEYFYPVDFRNSGKDLIQNHLTFYIFQHIAIWPKKYWPAAIGVNGYVNVEGEKMSKSKGNIIPLRELIEQFGPDLVRINMIASNEGMNDADWRVENIKGYMSRLEMIYDLAKDLEKAKEKKIRNIDIYLQNSIQEYANLAIENYENIRFRSGLNSVLFNSTNSLKWYLKRVGGIKNANKKILKECLEIIVKLIAPITPHLSDEIWEMLANKKPMEISLFKNVDRSSQELEDYLRLVIDDIEEIKRISQIKPKSVYIFAAEDWKFKIYQKILKNKNKSLNEITKEIMEGDMKKYGKATVFFIQSVYKNLNELKPIIAKELQCKIIEESIGFIEKEVGCKVILADASKSDHPKAKSASPQRPGIFLE